jgi:hypothetical protein
LFGDRNSHHGNREAIHVVCSNTFDKRQLSLPTVF